METKTIKKCPKSLSELYYPGYCLKWVHPGHYQEEFDTLLDSFGKNYFSEHLIKPLFTDGANLYEKEIKSFNSEDWKNFLQKANQLFVSSEEDGGYRTKNLYFTRGEQASIATQMFEDGLMGYFKTGNKRNLELCLNIKETISTGHNLPLQELLESKEEEMTFLKEYLHVPMPVIEIPAEIEALCFQLTMLGKDNCSPFEFAATVYLDLTRIMPFKLSNGMTARFLMNVILGIHGLNPVVFTNRMEYLNETRKGDDEPNSFENYLKGKEKQMQRLLAKGLLDNPKFCFVCEKFAEPFCKQCEITHYCSKECQKSNWPTHKEICNKN